jgi:hypothetical protein
MQLNLRTFDSVLESFLKRWSVSDIEQMSIEDYADLKNPDSFCYWLEYGSKEIGAIGGIALQKFGLWIPREPKETNGKPFITDGRYIWNRYKGESSRLAFEKIKELILSIVKCSKNRQWEAIDDIDFHSVVKWKLAFIYSNKAILPIYARTSLISIAAGLGKDFSEEKRSSVIQQFILGFRNEGEHIKDFAWGLWGQYIEKKLNKKYYIVGSKYGDEAGKDTVPMFDQFMEHQCIAIGFMGEVDFSMMMGNEPQKINDFIEDHYEESSVAIDKRQRYFRLLSQLKEGDIIAVKSRGNFGTLIIIAYAEVVKRNGTIYTHRPNDLGHCIHVDYLDVGLSKQMHLNYAGTLHQISRDNENFYKIFGWYAEDDEPTTELEEVEQGSKDLLPGYNEKKEDSFHRNALASVKVQRIHNQIQNQFIKYLALTYPDTPPGGEQRGMDVFRATPDEIIIYEIKTSQSPYYCIREGLGQLIDYSHQEKVRQKKTIVIVGQNEPDQSDISFINTVRKIVNLSFKYIAFDKEKMTVKEF